VNIGDLIGTTLSISLDVFNINCYGLNWDIMYCIVLTKVYFIANRKTKLENLDDGRCDFKNFEINAAY